MQTIQYSVSKGIQSFDLGCDQVAKFLDKHPTSYKVVLVASHLFRSGSMFSMMGSLPLSSPAAFGVLIAPSLLYRSAIERFCNFRFTLPSLAGAAAFCGGKAAMISFATKAAFTSISSLGAAILGAASLAAYLAFICHLSHSDVERHMQTVQKRQCCL